MTKYLVLAFLEKCCGIYLYDIDTDKQYTIGDEEIKFIKKGNYALIGNTDNPDETSTDYEYFLIHDDSFEFYL